MLEIKQNKQMSKQGYDKKKYQFFVQQTSLTIN